MGASKGQPYESIVIMTLKSAAFLTTLIGMTVVYTEIYGSQGRLNFLETRRNLNDRHPVFFYVQDFFRLRYYRESGEGGVRKWKDWRSMFKARWVTLSFGVVFQGDGHKHKWVLHYNNFGIHGIYQSKCVILPKNSSFTNTIYNRLLTGYWQ